MVKLMISFAALYKGDIIMFFMVLSLKSAISSSISCLHPPKNEIKRVNFNTFHFSYSFQCLIYRFNREQTYYQLFDVAPHSINNNNIHVFIKN